MDHAALVKAMKDPAFYPHPVDGVEYIQTHVSSVFLTGEFAYKLKKPVDFGFLDFSTVELREKNCRKELALNRRLAARAYLRVAPIHLVEGVPMLDGGGSGLDAGDSGLDAGGSGLDAGGSGLDGGDSGLGGGAPKLDASGDPVDWVVVMRQMDQALLGPSVLERGELTPDRIDALVEILVPFYEGARTGEGVDRWGEAEVFKFTTDENFQQTAGNVGQAISREAYDFIRDFTDAFFEEKADLFQRRIAQGRIRECHGDLHLGNIFFEEEPVIFDCIEFNDRLSCTDIAADLGFLAMDLDFRGEAELARRALDRYVEKSGDAEFPEIVGFYQTYRAYVRGKIACFTAADPSLDEAARKGQIELASRYFELAHRYARAAG